MRFLPVKGYDGLRKLARELGHEHLLDASLKQQAAARARINGNPHL